MRVATFVFTLLIALFSSCNPKSPSQTRQELNLNIPSDPMTFDPRNGGDVCSSLFHFLTFEGLTRLDDNGEIQPALAKKIELSEDKKTYTFHLKEAYWSDGTPITAWDFEKSWKDILQPDFPAMNAHLLYAIKNGEKAKRGLIQISEVGINAKNSKILEVTLEHPCPYFLDLVGFCVFFPVNSALDLANPDWAAQENYVCSGPFKLTKWKHSNEITLEKNPFYHKASTVALDQIHFTIVNSEMTALQMFEKGELDVIGDPLIPLPADAIAQIAKKEKLVINRSPATTFCAFNVDTFPLNNLHIRKALSFAIDRQQIVQNITQLHEEPALSMIPPVLKKSKEKKIYFQDGDQTEAQMEFTKGLEELGIAANQFPTLKYLYSNSEENHKIAQVLQQQWQQTLNITIELESLDKKLLIHRLKTRTYQIAQTFWIAQYSDPYNILERFKSKDNVKNYPHWENSRYIELLNLSCEAKDEVERALLIDQAEKVFIEEMPIAPLFHWNSVHIKKPYVKSHGDLAIGNGFFDRVYIDTHEKYCP